MTSIQPITAPSETPPPPRRRFSIAKKLVVITLGLMVVLLFATVFFVLATNAKIDRIPGNELTSLPAPAGGVRNFLIVGSDSREDLPEDFDDVFGRFAGARTDLIMLAHLLPGGAVQILSLPRDLKVQLPGKGTQKINAAYVFGGPDLLVKTVQDLTGVPVHHYVEIDFGGFARLVEAIGGVTLHFDHPARDVRTGFKVEAGTHALDGEEAVAYVRSRQYQELHDGKWVGTRTSDIGRTRRQQQVMVALFERALSFGGAFNIPGFASTLAGEITADSGLSLGVLIELGRAAISVDATNIERTTLPVEENRENNVSYVVPIEPDGALLLDAFREGVPYPDR